MKKFFSLLATVAILFSAVACNHGTTDIGAIGTISGGDVAYDEKTGTVSKELTINLNGAKLKEDLKAGKELTLSCTSVDGITVTTVGGEKADATSFKVLVSGTPSVEGYDSTALDFYFILSEDDEILTVTDASRLPYITGGKLTGLRTTATIKPNDIDSADVTDLLSGATLTGVKIKNPASETSCTNVSAKTEDGASAGTWTVKVTTTGKVTVSATKDSSPLTGESGTLTFTIPASCLTTEGATGKAFIPTDGIVVSVEYTIG